MESSHSEMCRGGWGDKGLKGSVGRIGITSGEAAFFRDPPVPSDKENYVTFDKNSEFSMGYFTAVGL